MSERRLNTIQDVRRYLASLINRTEKGALKETTAKSLTYITSILMRAIEGSDLEHRIEELEKRTNGGKP